MDGVVSINKPTGITSHDVVLRARRILGERRIGHTGTLDPLATGVLVLCAGRATRIARYLEAEEKEYRAVMRLGITTDTLDAEGLVLETRNYAAPDREELERVLRGFTGRILQRPPAYSAVKVGGVPSYKLARSGQAQPHEPRPVAIHALELTSYDDPFVGLSIRCSKGVYVRTLCADIGEALGAGAHLTELVRTRSGRFTIDGSLTFDQLAERTAAVAERVLISMDEALAHMPFLRLDDRASARVLHGNQVACAEAAADRPDEPVRIQDAGGRLLAVGRIVAGSIRPELVFA
jgi:tRNA pseudouridine55 synthase